MGVNLAVLTMLLPYGFRAGLCVALAIVVSMVWNFVLNRRFSFSYARDQSILRQFAAFIAACSVGGIVNYVSTMALWGRLPSAQLAAVFGVIAGTLFNFLASRFWVFRARYVKR